MLAPTWQSAVEPPVGVRRRAEKRPSPRRAMSSRKTRSTGSSAQKREDLRRASASTVAHHGIGIHVRTG